METFKKRLWSFVWRLGNFLAIAGLDWVATNVGLLDLPVWGVALVALVTAEGTKWLNR